MPAAVPFIPQIIGGASAGLSALLGKKSKATSAATNVKPYAPNPAYTKPLGDFAGSLLPMAQQGFQSSLDYHRGVMADPAAATASDAASLGRQTQMGMDRLARTPGRGGYQAFAASQLPTQQMAAGLDRRLAAQQGSANSLASIAGTAGGLGTSVFGNLLGTELGGYQASNQAALGGGYLDLANRREDRDYYGNIGGSIFDILNSPTGGGGGSIFDRLAGLGKKGPSTSLPGGRLPGLSGGLGSIMTPPTFRTPPTFPTY